MTEPTAPLSKDPVCGMRLRPEEVQATSVYRGKTYSFCSSACQQKFELAPEKYVESPNPHDH